MSQIFGRPVRRLEPRAIDAPTTKTYHGLELLVDNFVVGRITNWNPNIGERAGNHVYELNVASFGRPVDYVPAVVTGFNIAMAHVELWNEELEIALGYNAQFDDLTDQTRPFRIRECLWRGQTLYRQWIYLGCWFQNRNEEPIDASGDGIYKVSATVAYIQRQRMI